MCGRRSAVGEWRRFYPSILNTMCPRYIILYQYSEYRYHVPKWFYPSILNTIAEGILYYLSIPSTVSFPKWFSPSILNTMCRRYIILSQYPEYRIMSLSDSIPVSWIPCAEGILYYLSIPSTVSSSDSIPVSWVHVPKVLFYLILVSEYRVPK